MNKQDLIRTIATNSELTQRDAAILLDSTLDAIMSAVAAGEKVQLVGFGTFEAKHRAARIGRNPHTGEAIEIAEATVPTFHPGVLFKEKVGK